MYKRVSGRENKKRKVMMMRLEMTQMKSTGRVRRMMLWEGYPCSGILLLLLSLCGQARGQKFNYIIAPQCGTISSAF